MSQKIDYIYRMILNQKSDKNRIKIDQKTKKN